MHDRKTSKPDTQGSPGTKILHPQLEFTFRTNKMALKLPPLTKTLITPNKSLNPQPQPLAAQTNPSDPTNPKPPDLTHSPQQPPDLAEGAGVRCQLHLRLFAAPRPDLDGPRSL